MKPRRAGLSIVVAIAIFSWFGISASGAFAAPANDNFANAQTVGPALPATTAASNIGATAEPGEPDTYSNDAVSSVWFKWTAPASGIAVVDLCAAGFTGGSSPFTMIAVRTGATLGALALVAETAGRCSLRFNAVNGTNYKFQIDYRTDEGNFNFKLRQLAPPPNDNFASATTVGPALPVSVNGTTVDSGWQAGEPAILGGSSSSRSVWFNWTPAATGHVRIDVCTSAAVDGAANKVIAVYTGNALGSLVLVKSENTNCQFDFDVTAGVPQRIAVSGDISGELNFNLKLSSAPPPSNDNYSGAITVGPALPVKVQGNNDFATGEPGEPDHAEFSGAYHSVWYKWKAPATQAVRVRVCADHYGSRLGLYTGAPGTFTRVGTPPPWGPYCSVVLNAVAGTTYSIAAAGGPQDKTYGPFTLDIHALARPANDDFAKARDVGSTLPVSIEGTTVDAGIENGDPSSYPTVWYRWTAPSDDAMIFSACSSVKPANIGVYSGAVHEDLKEIAETDEGCRNGLKGGRLAIAPEKGQTYRIAVRTVQRDDEAPFTLTAIGPPVVKDPIVKPPVITPPKNTFNLAKEIKKCKKIKSKKKRAACIKKAKKKAAIIKCKKIKNGKAHNTCIKKARKRFR